VTAIDAVSVGEGRYGAIFWVAPKDVKKAAKVLGASSPHRYALGQRRERKRMLRKFAEVWLHAIIFGVPLLQRKRKRRQHGCAIRPSTIESYRNEGSQRTAYPEFIACRRELADYHGGTRDAQPLATLDPIFKAAKRVRAIRRLQRRCDGPQEATHTRALSHNTDC